MQKTILIAVILLIPATLWAQAGSTSFDFMLIGSSSRAAAMSESFTSIGGDAASFYFNPATLMLAERTQVSLMHISYLNDVTQENVNLVSGSKGFRFGLGFYYGKTANIERRSTIPTDDPLGTFDEHNFTASFGWAIPISDKLNFGNTLKWAYQKIDLSSASALVIDLGTTYSLNSNISLGASIRNFGTKPKFNSESFDLPREFRLGGSYLFTGNSPLSGLLAAADLVIPHWGDQDMKFNLGAEYTYQKLIALRTGYGVGYESKGFSIGGGINYRNYAFDYAYIPSKHNFDNMHRLTFRAEI
jgi:hypothetical protein